MVSVVMLSVVILIVMAPFENIIQLRCSQIKTTKISDWLIGENIKFLFYFIIYNCVIFAGKKIMKTL